MRIILNGKSAGSEPFRSAVTALRERGETLEVRVTWEQGDAERLAAEAIDQGVDTIVAAGGDGTLNEVIHGMMSHQQSPTAAVGLVPLGTANDFAKGCGLPIGDPLAALELIASQSPVPIDIARCNDRFFINVATGGFGAEVTANTPPELKRALGGAAYSLTGLVTAMQSVSCNATVSTPQGDTEHGEFLVLAAGNGCQTGGGFRVAPQAKLNDGLLDTMGVADVTFDQLGQIFAELADMTSPENQRVKYAQLEEFTVKSEQPMHMNLDGEPMLDDTFHFRVYPGAIRFLLPSDCPLLA